MIEALAVGLGFGLSGGLAPGPLHSLIMTTAVQRGFAAGTRIAVAPLLTDAPIIAATVFLVGSLSDAVVRTLGVAGGVFLLYLGVQTIRESSESELVPQRTAGQDYRRGVLVNLLNPHPWLFWIGVGAPTLIGFWRDSAAWAVVQEPRISSPGRLRPCGRSSCGRPPRRAEPPRSAGGLARRRPRRPRRWR